MKGSAIQYIEERRLKEQVRLDTLKTAAERNRWGQFATPPELALGIAQYARELMGTVPIRFLDPAIGTGSFYSALSQVFPAESVSSAVGIELDPTVAEAATDLWDKRGLRIVRGDFTKQRPPIPRFNLLLANPPYVRHHHLPTAEKSRLRTQVAKSLHLEISGLAGLYCYFLLLGHEWMEDGGLAVWLIPSEFMDVNYGVTLRRYLTERVTLLQIHRFSPIDVQFGDALVSSAIVVFRKAPPPRNHVARFSFAGTLRHPEAQALVPLDVLGQSRKWTQFPSGTPVDTNGELTLGDIFEIKRGLATGRNSFFILTEARLKTWQIPGQFLKPILPGPRYLTEDVVDALPDGSPAVLPRLYLLDCREPEEKVKSSWPLLYEYLHRGQKENVHACYLASRRVPWYSQEQRLPAPFLCTYMGRARSGRKPFRFIWNRSQATAHNVYLMLYPRGHLREALKKDPELEGHVFEALQNIRPAQLSSEGRIYGGGLHKLEPKELARIPARAVLDSLDIDLRIEEQAQLFS